jgi:hypothetical protein
MVDDLKSFLAVEYSHRLSAINEIGRKLDFAAAC